MNKLLIVVDAQNDFITGALANTDAQKKIQNIVNLIKNHDGIIVATHDTHFNKTQVSAAWPPEDHAQVYEETLEGQKLPIVHCIKLSEGWEIQKDILEACREKNLPSNHKFFAIDKYTFGYTNWKKYLETFKFDEIIMCGFCTDICVISNALILRAIYPNLPIKVVENCCAGVTPELHDAALKVMQSCQIDIV